MDWITGISKAIDYIEEHITEPTDYAQAAKEACSSPFIFQRVFALLCGYTLGDYVRMRRLTLAGDTRSRQALQRRRLHAALPSCRNSRRIRCSRLSLWPRYWEDQRHTAIIPHIVGARRPGRTGEAFSDFQGRLFL